MRPWTRQVGRATSNADFTPEHLNLNQIHSTNSIGQYSFLPPPSSGGGSRFAQRSMISHVSAQSVAIQEALNEKTEMLQLRLVLPLATWRSSLHPFGHFACATHIRSSLCFDFCTPPNRFYPLHSRSSFAASVSPSYNIRYQAFPNIHTNATLLLYTRPNGPCPRTNLFNRSVH